MSSSPTQASGKRIDRLFQRFGRHYILWMLLATRLAGSTGGILVVYYVNLTLTLPPTIRRHFYLLALIVCAVAVLITIFVGLWETRRVRRVVNLSLAGDPIPAEEARLAGRDAVLFAAEHHRREALIVPASTLVPVLLFLKYVDSASATMLFNITLAVFMGIAMSLLSTFLLIERLMRPVIQHLLSAGVEIDFESLPASRLRVRLNLCFGLIILVTALMIGTLARQRAADIVRNPQNQKQAVANLQAHSYYISIAAVAVGIVFSSVLGRSVASRVDHLVRAMKRVEQGCLSERMAATGNDEIDTLTRQFNTMVSKLSQNDQTIRDLNATLERKVKKRTRQLRRSLKRLVENDRLKTEFFSNVSHELRTPLTMIVSPVERLLEKHGSRLDGEVLALVDVIRINGSRLLELINQLLEFSKLEAGRARLNLTTVNLNKIIEDLAAAAKPLITQRQLTLQIASADDLPTFTADEEKIDTVLSNLISNAIKFTPAGGTIRVKTARHRDRLYVCVSDTGIGIAESDYDRIFERFVQIDGSASREFPGTGLGLPLAKQFVELHGGSLQLESTLGQGSRFEFELPFTPPTAPDLSATPPVERRQRRRSTRFADLASCEPAAILEQAPPASLAEGSEKVLVVDDTPEVRGLLGNVLADHYHVVYAGDGGEGLEVAARENPDLIISDVMMPNVDGYEFCRRIKGDPATMQIPFVLLTAKAERSMKIEGLNCGADDYLVKPFDSEELRARVRSLLKMRHLHKELDGRNSTLEATLKELRDTQTQLVHSEKMSSIGQLVAGLAHEINNSINAVYNGIQPLRSKALTLRGVVRDALAEQDAAGAESPSSDIDTAFEKITVLADIIESGASRAARIVSDLKTFSHPGSEAPAPFDIHETLDMCLNLLFSQIKHRITVTKQYGEVGPAYGPRVQLSQVFMNIINNAQQSIADEGEITIRTTREDQRIFVTIRDTGHGIPEDVRGRIFDPFFTTKEPGVGTGLGLAISYGLISKLGGTISFTSTIGEGTEFNISLPVVAPAAPPRADNDIATSAVGATA